MSFWINKPVIVVNNTQTFKQILNNEELLNKTLVEIDKMQCKINLNYHIVNWKECTNNKKHEILDFINTNYITSADDNYKLKYTIELLEFYCKDAMIIEFYDNNKNIYGYIMGKKETIKVDKEDFKILEVNFLCILVKLRSIGISSYMINILTKESILAYNIGVAHYTISASIKSPYFCEKDFYHRVLNVDKLNSVDFFNSNINIDVYKHLYNTFEYKNNFKSNHYVKCVKGSCDSKLIDELYLLYTKYNQDSFVIYENVDINKFKESFTNNAFTHFIIYKNKSIVSYISMFELDTLYKTATRYKSGFLYYMFFTDKSLSDSFNLICEYIHTNNIYDLITFGDIFKLDYNELKCIKGTGNLKYYLFNIESSEIEACKNALTTI